MKIVIVGHLIDQKSCLLFYIDSRSLLEYFIDIAKQTHAEALRILSPCTEDIRKIIEEKDICVEFIKPDEINTSDIRLEGNYLYTI